MIRQDKAVVLAAVVQDGDALQFASPCFKNYRSIVLAAVRQNPDALQHASQEIRHLVCRFGLRELERGTRSSARTTTIPAGREEAKKGG